jgi:hypothetical protein
MFQPSHPVLRAAHRTMAELAVPAPPKVGDKGMRELDGIWFDVKVTAVHEKDLVTVEYKDDGAMETDVEWKSGEMKFPSPPSPVETASAGKDVASELDSSATAATVAEADRNSTGSSSSSSSSGAIAAAATAGAEAAASVARLTTPTAVVKSDDKAAALVTQQQQQQRERERELCHLLGKASLLFCRAAVAAASKTATTTTSTTSRSSSIISSSTGSKTSTASTAAAAAAVVEGVGVYWPLAGRCCHCVKLTPYRCRRCGTAFYCSKACQTKHWTAEHRKTCSPAAFVSLSARLSTSSST